MKTPGIVRTVDNLGRIVVPAEIRRAMGVDKGDALLLYMEEDAMVMRKYAPSCIFCGCSDDMTSYEGKNICAKCIENIKKV